MPKEIKEEGGEAGNDSTMEAKAEEGFQRSSTDLDWEGGGWRAKRRAQQKQFDHVPRCPFQCVSVKVQGYLLLQTIREKGLLVWGFGCWFFLSGIGLERFPRAYSLYNPFGIK